MEVEPAILAEDVVFLADDGDDRNDWWVRDGRVSVSHSIDLEIVRKRCSLVTGVTKLLLCRLL